jgi:predicted O-linked N-acetylglucosamine transferase (SPINDLY family)
LAESERDYRIVLSHRPRFGPALHGLGLVLHLQGQSGTAAIFLEAAVAEVPDCAEFRSNFAAVLGSLGRHQEASRELAAAVQHQPDYPEGWCNLGVALEKQGRFEEAIEAYRKATQLTPAYAEAHQFLGNSLRKLRRWQEAAAAYREVLRLKPRTAPAHHDLGLCLQSLKRYREAATEYELAISCDPTATGSFQQLGCLLHKVGKYPAAAKVLKRAVELQPQCRGFHRLLAHAHTEMGNIDPAIEHLRQLVALAPDSPAIRSSLLYTLHYDGKSTPESLFEEHREWDRRHGEPLQTFRRPHDNDRYVDRRLRVGYVSPDFREHTVPRFISAAIEHHDRDRFEVFCYSNSNRKDATTARLQGWADQWQTICTLTDEKADQLIRDDKIDILVDLRGHAANNRLTLFARKPAPVQVVMVGYFDTTGLSTMDYRITDERQDPSGLTDPFHVERLVRLPQSGWCYTADDEAPEVADLPMLSNGYITFGCLNKIIKVTPECARLWGSLLQSVPRSRLLLVAPEADRSGSLRRRLSQYGIPTDRLTIMDKAPTHGDYLQRFNMVDIGLDPFPFNGITTSCDGLWMGMPFVTLTGRTSVSRVGNSMLSAVGLADLVAHDPQTYLRLASALAEDHGRLRELRRGMRERMRYSHLMNARHFASSLDAAFQQMWETWCNDRELPELACP